MVSFILNIPLLAEASLRVLETADRLHQGSRDSRENQQPVIITGEKVQQLKSNRNISQGYWWPLGEH